MTRFNLVAVDDIPIWVCGFQAIPPLTQVFLVCRKDVFSHMTETSWTIDFKRLFAPNNAGRKDQVGVTGSVV